MDATPSASGLVSFSGRISLVGTRRISIGASSGKSTKKSIVSGNAPFAPWNEAFLRLHGDAITIYKDEEYSELLMGSFSTENMTLAKRKDNVFKMYFRVDGTDTIVRMSMEESLATAFSFLLHESWAHSKRGGWSERIVEEWDALVRGCTRKRSTSNSNESKIEERRKTSIMITKKYLIFLYNDGSAEEKIDLRKVASCRLVARQCINSIALDMTYPQVIWIDSGEMKAVSTLRSIIYESTAVPQSSLLTCRLSSNDVPIVIEEAIKFVSTEKRISTLGIYRVSANKTAKDKLVDRMIHAPSTVFLSISGFGMDAKDQVYLVCDGLRSFLRRMESPLIPEVLHIPLFDAMEEQSLRDRTVKVSNVLQSRRLPPEHKKTLALILSHLGEVAKRSDKNGMTTNNLATVFAPCLFSSESSLEVVEDISPRVSSTLFLIENYHLLLF